MANNTTPVTKFCVVCGMGSTREDWQSVANPACDSHTADEVKAAVAGKTPATKQSAASKGKGATETTPAPAAPAE